MHATPHPPPLPSHALLCPRSYTGYMPGMSETFKKTPMMAQLETKAPGEESFIHTRTASPPKAQPARDPCNFPESFKVRCQLPRDHALLASGWAAALGNVGRGEARRGPGAVNGSGARHHPRLRGRQLAGQPATAGGGVTANPLGLLCAAEG